MIFLIPLVPVGAPGDQEISESLGDAESHPGGPRPLINNDRLPDLLLDLDASRDVPGAQTCSTSAAGLLAQEMLTKVDRKSVV